MHKITTTHLYIFPIDKYKCVGVSYSHHKTTNQSKALTADSGRKEDIMTNTTTTTTTNTAIINNNTLVVKGKTVEYIKTVAPKLVTNEEAFFNALNKTLVLRYVDEYTVKLHNSKETLSKAEKTMNDLINKESDEYESAEKTANKARENVTKYSSILKSLKTEREALKDVETPEDLEEIINFYSLLYSRVGGINIENNKTLERTLFGMRDLFTTCKDYADKYENTADEWTETRHSDFKAIKEKLEAIGSRLNGDATDNRKGFKYSVSNKDVFRLVAYVTKQSTHSKGTGKFSEKRNSIENFQYTVICTIFRMKTEDITTNYEIEC